MRKAPVAGSPAFPRATGTILDTTLFLYQLGELAKVIDRASEAVHAQNITAGWWHDVRTGLPLQRNVGELLCLIHSEVSEAMEGHRKGLQDDKLPHRPMIEVELADAVIRILDLAGAMNLQLGAAIREKIIFNMTRPDHKREARMAEGGKAF